MSIVAENAQPFKYYVFRDKDNIVKVKNLNNNAIDLTTLNDTSGIAYAVANDTSGEGVWIAGNFSGGARFVGTLNVQGSISGDSVVEDYNYLLYKDKGVYKLKNGRTGNIDFQHTSQAGPPLMSGMATLSGNSSNLSGGLIRIGPGRFVLGSGFTGVDIPKWCGIEMTQSTVLDVPQSYSGYVFRMGDNSGTTSSVTQMYVKGGYLREANTPQKLWVGVQLETTVSAGVTACKIDNLRVDDARAAIQFVARASGYFVNGINVYDGEFVDCVNFIEFVNEGVNDPFNRNLFVGIVGQFGSSTAVGFKDIGPGSQNIFIECKAWDAQLSSGGSGVSSNIVSGAQYTKIIGGIMTHSNFTDSGQNSYYDDDKSGARFGQAVAMKSTLSVSGNLTVGSSITTSGSITLYGANINHLHTSPNIIMSGNTATYKLTNNASGGDAALYLTPGAGSGGTSTISFWGGNNVARRFFLQQTVTNSIINGVRQATDGSAPNIIFQIQDVVNTTTLEPMRFDASGNIQFNKSGGTAMRFASGIPMGLSGQGVISFDSGVMNLSGLNFIGTRTSGATAGSGSIISGQVQTWLQVNVGGSLLKIPAFNV